MDIHPAVIAYRKEIASLGGVARKAALSPERRVEIAKKANKARQKAMKAKKSLARES